MATWTLEELKLLLREISHHRLAVAYVVAASTGMRRGEVLGLAGVTFTSTTAPWPCDRPSWPSLPRSWSVSQRLLGEVRDLTGSGNLRARRANQSVDRLAVGERYSKHDLVKVVAFGDVVKVELDLQLLEPAG